MPKGASRPALSSQTKPVVPRGLRANSERSRGLRTCPDRTRLSTNESQHQVDRLILVAERAGSSKASPPTRKDRGIDVSYQSAPTGSARPDMGIILQRASYAPPADRLCAQGEQIFPDRTRSTFSASRSPRLTPHRILGTDLDRSIALIRREDVFRDPERRK